ncbi:efflux RND transporter periplasmic adaptor subunit [Sedimenticola thiotaurini]|uniref:Hemolysin D n=1 Tax=Sedimenticola thiotaurini TaxID=1543721 RepID=A0A0F7K297_9GAMM|nr:efflux RND transporter periplasmic adaptor subunit [Sedimenticola thiotaurini]AKH21659.1 hemolysin D [Sedimenticola thiotaurini]
MPVLSRYRGGILILLLALLASGCNGSDSTSSESAVAPAAPVPVVGVQEVRQQSLVLNTELAGRTTAYRIAEVRPQVTGIIVERTFQEGGEVKAGQTLYRIDPARYQAAYDSAKSTLARDQAALTTARLKVKRYANLLKTKAVSQEAYDEARAALQQAQATVAMDEAALQAARIDLDYTQVSAPIDGRIGRSAVTQGALVTGNQTTALATIRQLDPIYVDVTQSSAELLRLKKALGEGELQRPEGFSAPVELILEDGSRYPHPGKLEFSEVSVDESTGSVTLRALFPNPDQQLLPGMYVRAQVQNGVREGAILVPQQAVSRDAAGRTTALVLNGDDQVEKRSLTVSRAVGNQWLVEEGLTVGERLIVDGLQKIQPGDTARATPLTAETTPGSGVSTPN